MATRDTVADLAEQFALAFLRLGAALETPEGKSDLLRELGWDFPTPPTELDALVAPVAAITAFADLEQLTDDQIPLLLAAAAGAFTAIANTSLPGDVNGEFPKQLADFVVVRYFFDQQPVWGFLLLLLGIVSIEQIATPPSGRLPYVAYSFAYAQIPNLLSDPLPFLKTQYRWGHPDFKGELLLGGLEGFLDAWQLRVQRGPLSGPFLAALQQGAVSPSTASVSPLWLVLVRSSLSPATSNMGMGLYLLPETASARPGFALLPFASAGFNQEVDLGESLTLSLSAELDLTGGVGIFVRPDQDVSFTGGLASGAPTPIAGALAVQLKLQTPGEPIVILGSQDGSRLQLGGLSATGGIRVAGGSREVFTEFATEGGRIIVAPGSDSDSFLGSLLPSDGIDSPFGLTVGFSTIRGLYFNAAGGFEITIPASLRVGSVEMQSLKIAVRPANGAVQIDIGAAFAASLSAVTANVDGVGLTANLTFPSDRNGNLGPADLRLKFKPPTGIGIFIESSSVSGGGFLFFDEPNGRYGGAVELRAYSIDIKAFGLIETKVPGVDFSFVIVISAEFNPIQLGFGFTLNGVGGLIGINRTVNSDEVSKRLRDGTVDNILFPTNLIQNAPQIISDLAALFPAADSRYVFGPLAKLGWAGIVNGTIGVILELPSKAVTLIGNINAILPKPDNAIVVIDMDIAGKLDFPKKHFELDATLSPNSKLGAYTITGDMATRIDWGDRPNFAISMGGFHSQFKPPPGFPRLRPLAIDLGLNGNPSVTLQGFMALTSNTAQIGAQLDIYASFGATLTGNVGFEAMFVFSPFSFDARLWGSVHVEFLGVGFGMTLNGRITGPSPWTIDGEVCVSLWFDSACVGIHEKLDGAPTPETLPLLDPWEGFPVNAPLSAQEVPGLRPAIGDPRNWAGRLPAGALIGVSYVERKGREELVDPVGIATLRQKSVPLAYDITQYAGRAPSRRGKLNITGTTVGGIGASTDYVTDWFAPGQYRKMSNDEALAAQPFEQLKAGVELQGKVARVGSVRARSIEYRTHVLDAQGNEVEQFDHQLPPRHLDGTQRSSSVARLSARLSGRTRFVDITQARKMTDEIESFSLTSKLDLTLVAGAAKVTRSEAAAALDALAGPSAFKRQQYQIVGFHLAV